MEMESVFVNMSKCIWRYIYIYLYIFTTASETVSSKIVLMEEWMSCRACDVCEMRCVMGVGVKQKC